MRNDINPPVPFIAQGLVCNWGEIHAWARDNSLLYREACQELLECVVPTGMHTRTDKAMCKARNAILKAK